MGSTFGWGERVKCLIVVAHPDDEVIWMGGCILRHPEWDWSELSLCRAGDVDREPRFRSAARALGVRERISDLDDSAVLAPLAEDLHEITDRVKQIADGSYDLIFTHGHAGEYTRHPRHEQVHAAVRRMIGSGVLTGSLICFAYADDGGHIRPKPSEEAEIILRLSDEEFERKRRIVRDIYNFPEGSFEFDSAGRIEAFRVFENDRKTDLRRMLEVGMANGGFEG